MKISNKSLLNIIGIGLIIIYYFLVPSNNHLMQAEAIISILLCVILVIKSRKAVPLMVALVFITYCIYSIGIGEYLIRGDLGVPFTQVKIQFIYATTLRILFLFLFILTLYFPKIENFRPIKPKDNVVIFLVLVIALIFIGLFGIDRVHTSKYTVSISPIYEYSILLFLFAYYSSGNKPIRKLVILILMGMFIIQDFYYGGRITSMQIILVAISTIFYNRVTSKSALLITFVGIFVNSIVGVYRSNFTLEGFNLINFFITLRNRWFVFDTPVYAYYASATHVASVELINLSINERLGSLINFILSIFMGSESNSGNVTRYVSENYFSNLGGGLLPTHFYFWLGYLGVIIAAVIILLILRMIIIRDKELYKLVTVVFISTIPRWFLYNPLTMFRMIFFVCLLYPLFELGHKFLTLSIKDVSNDIN